MFKKAGFLFNHDEIHQVAHIAPIILYLRRVYPHIRVVAMVSSTTQLDRLYAIIGNAVDPGLEVRVLGIPLLLRHIFRITNNLAPLQRLYILKHYKSLFGELDCLVVPEMTSSRLKTHLGMTNTPLILLPHGAGDREIGFTEEIRHFDHILLSGTKVRDRMLNLGLITKANHTLVGYPKFDCVTAVSPPRTMFFNDDKPVVLYNPHFDPQLSSWYTMGHEVLEFFSASRDFNLIFAPHIMLFKKHLHIALKTRAFKFVHALPRKYYHCPNIHIDTGSTNSVNMTYTLNADVYLGDVSSQLYEFLMEPRPCIFLNAHKAKWQNDPSYLHWHCGPVLNTVANLKNTLTNIELTGRQYRVIQQRSFAETFDLNGEPSSLRAADSIASFLHADTAVAA